jgi:hypothetical protein
MQNKRHVQIPKPLPETCGSLSMVRGPGSLGIFRDAVSSSADHSGSSVEGLRSCVRIPLEA